jgi:hypothetical protein
MFLSDFIQTARHAHPNVNTETDYRQRQGEALASVQRAYPNMPTRGVHKAETKPAAFISGGRWLVECTECGNCPVIEPDWKLALCYECGAVYEDIDMPEDRTEIERLLLLRKSSYSVRYWNPHLTLDHLREENKLLGVGGNDDGISS